MKILVTGASGLLGSEISQKLGSSDLRISQLTRQCLKPRDGFLSANLTSDQGLDSINSAEWDLIIHTAAWRDPDTCERDRETTFAINARATEILAKFASARNAKFIYVSTDYVFPGTNPPYSEDDTPAPVNYYGETKLLGEESVQKICKDSLIVRVPLLYGIAAGLGASALLSGTLKALDSSKPWPMEDSIVRYPTWTGDVADAIIFLIKRNAEGIFHVSSEDKTTRYRITETMAEVFGKSMANILHLAHAPEGEAKRPKDAHLSIDKITDLGFPHPLPFKERIRILKSALQQ